MRRRNNRSFTLIELIAVLVVLAIILAIAVPSITGVIKAAKEKACILDAGMMEKAARNYATLEGLVIKEGSTTTIPLKTLQSTKYVSIIYSPEDRRTECVGYVNVTNSSGNYQYKGYLKCSNVCKTAGYNDQLENGNLNDIPGLVDKNGAKYFVGGNPNNWVKFGRFDQNNNHGLLWRIIKIDNDGIKMVFEGLENGGTQPAENGRVLINATTGIPWDTTGSNKWEKPVSLKGQIGSWFNNDIYVINMDNYVVAANWKIGGIPYNDPTKLETFQNYEDIDSSDIGGFFKGLTSDKTVVGLSNPSDFISTSSNVSCVSSYREVGSGNECAIDDDSTLNNFLYKNKYHWWTMNARSDVDNRTWIINNVGQIATTFSNSSVVSVRPVINLKKGLTYYAGTGTIEDPYILEQYMVGILDKPVLTLNGTNPLAIHEGETYIEEGAKAIDEQDGDISNQLVITSDVNTKVPGSYTVTYNVTDSDGNMALPITRDVTVVEKDRPILNLKGTNPMYVTLNHPYVEPGAMATDLNDGDISANIVISGTVDTSQLGVYEVNYNVTNSEGKAAYEVTRKVIVEVPKPVITVNGDTNVLVEIGSTYIDAGATAIDEVDGDLTSSIVKTIYLDNKPVSTINVAAVGSYIIEYQVTNSLGGGDTKYRYVNVVSAEGPTITFNPNGDLTPKKQNKTTVTVTQNKFPVVTDSVKYLWHASRGGIYGKLEDAINNPFVSGDVISINRGTDYYYLYAIAKDTYDNTTIKRSNAFLIDNSKPVIYLNGRSVVNVLINSTYTDAGATAYDYYYDGDLTDKIIVTSNVNTSAVGTYFVTYTVSDKAGNVTTVRRMVNVNNPVPLVTLNGPSSVRVRIDTPYIDLGATAMDPLDGDITNKIIATGMVDTSKAGTYIMTYSVTNSFGVTTTRTRNVVVYIPQPVITLNGGNQTILVGSSYTDLGATATDEVDGYLTSSITSSGTVNPNVVDTYYITYSVTNSYGQTTTKIRTVIVKNPEIVITISGNNPYVMDVGDVYVEQGATATDEKDGDLTSSITTVTTLNPNIIGTYSVVYSVTNSTGITKTVTRTIKVVPLKGPIITLSPLGDSTWKKSHNVTITVAQNKKPVDNTSLKYVWTTSLVEPTDSSYNIIFTSGAIIPTPPGVTGIYYLHVIAKDTEGNVSTLSSNAFRVDNTPPVITLNGQNNLYVPIDGTYSDAGGKATDADSGLDATGLVITSDVNTGVIGTYHVTFTATDKAGNITIVKRSVIVKEISLVDAIDDFIPKYYAEYFVGSNPNNWIEFGAVSPYDERPLLWRIVKSDPDGVKIIYEGIKNDINAPVDDGRLLLNGVQLNAYDTSNSNKWNSPVSISSKLQTWYDNLYEPDKSILTTPINWCIGGINAPYAIDDFKAGECSDTNSTGGSFAGKSSSKIVIGLLNSSDYMLTGTGTCASYNSSGCGTNNYLAKGYDYLTINADANSASNIFAVKANAGLDRITANFELSVRPVINLKSNVLILGGEGTLESPYKLNNRPPTFDVTPPLITIETNGNSSYAKTASTKVTVIDNKAVNTDEVKYLWTKNASEPSYEEFKNVFTSGDILSSPTGIEGEYYLWIYAKDIYNNESKLRSNVFYVDNVGPTLAINLTSDLPLDDYATATINFGDATTMQYKIGNGATWTNYTTPVSISSYDIINGNLKNADGTATIYARGLDQYGNETIISKIISNLDLKAPAAPIISSSSGYPMMTEYGVTVDTATTIVYDSMPGLTNYYSLDGTTWNIYTGAFQSGFGTVYAKSTKNVSGLTTYVTKTISMPADALPAVAYDGNDTTNVRSLTNALMRVDTTMIGKEIRIKWSTYVSGPPTLSFLDSNKSVIQQITCSTSEQFLVIPNNTYWISISASSDYVYEIGQSDEPNFSIVNGYMLLHADASKIIRNPYQTVTVTYFPTSVQKLYRIGTSGEWLNYVGPVKVNQGETIYAKGIDQYGHETRIISSYTANVTDSVPPEIYDGDDATFARSMTNAFMQIDSSLIGQTIRIKWSTYVSVAPYIQFLDVNKNLIQQVTCSAAEQYIVIPNNAYWLTVTASTDYVYEIGVSNEPKFTATNGYMLLHADPAQIIRTPYQTMDIAYFPTSAQKLYSIGTSGVWLNYTNPVRVNQGDTIYAKGIDQYGNETRIVSSYTANVTDSIPTAVYDDNDTTNVRSMTNALMQIDSSMIGKQITIKWSTYVSGPPYIQFLDVNKNLIQQVSCTTSLQYIVVPANAYWLRMTASTDYVYEIRPVF